MAHLKHREATKSNTVISDPRKIDEFSYLKCLYTNADSLANKFDVFKERLLDQDPDIASIVETWTQGAQNSPRYCPDEFLHISGYQMYRQDNATDIKGGILVYVKDQTHQVKLTRLYVNN